MEDLNAFSDEELQKLAVSGDSRAEDVLAGRYARLVRVCARPYFLAGGNSEDLTQEGMLGLLSAIREYDPGQGVPFRSYAELCIRRRIFSAIRTASRGKHEPLNSGISLEEVFGEDSDPTGPYSIPAFQRTPEEQVLAKESAYEFFQAFSRCLSPFEQKILDLYLDGWSYHQIAVECGRDDKAVDNAIQRIRRKLARILPSGDNSKS